MRHKQAGWKLKRDVGARKALFRGLVTSIIEQERVVTTVPKAKAVRPTLFCAYRDVQRMVRDERWKLIRYPQINRSQLFDLKKDPHELHDLADEPRQKARIGRLMSEMARWRKELGDTVPLTASQPRPAAFAAPTADELAAMRRKLKM